MIDMTNVINPMTKQECEEWIIALNSGEFPKGLGRLSVVNEGGSTSYCCLGVEEQIHGDKCLINRKAEQSFLREWGEYIYNKSPNPTYTRLPRDVQSLLAGKNDAVDTFEPVIDIIIRDILPQLQDSYE